MAEDFSHAPWVISNLYVLNIGFWALFHNSLHLTFMLTLKNKLSNMYMQRLYQQNLMWDIALFSNIHLKRLRNCMYMYIRAWIQWRLIFQCKSLTSFFLLFWKCWHWSPHNALQTNIPPESVLEMPPSHRPVHVQN